MKDQLENLIKNTISTLYSLSEEIILTVPSSKEHGDFTTNIAMQIAKKVGKNPREVGNEIITQLQNHNLIQKVEIAGPGFINIFANTSSILEDINHFSIENKAQNDKKILVDFGGANVAKPLHVGHLRSAVIGESLKRICKYLGYDVIGDVHLGDWGLQMGMVITEVKRRQPDLPYFDPNYIGQYPSEAPFTIQDLEEIYPAASKLCKESEEAMNEARLATNELQQGRAGYRALWQHIEHVSIADLQKNYNKLNVFFDLWDGESTVQALVSPMVEKMKNDGYAVESKGAWIIDVTEPTDKNENPPLILVSSHKTDLYATTDLATILHRVQQINPDLILYVVDNRQSQHFVQVFRAARKTGLAPDSLTMEHIAFGTVNGKDGKPFKTRAGGTMKLSDLLEQMISSAQKKLESIKAEKDYSEAEQEEISLKVGVAAVKFADLINHRQTNYIFDLDKFLSFEGKTGPYLLYTIVRTKSILSKAKDLKIEIGGITGIYTEEEKELIAKILQFQEIVEYSFRDRAPNHLAEYTFELANIFNKFYNTNHILNENDKEKQASWLALTLKTQETLEKCAELLGIETLERM